MCRCYAYLLRIDYVYVRYMTHTQQSIVLVTSYRVTELQSYRVTRGVTTVTIVTVTNISATSGVTLLAMTMSCYSCYSCYTVTGV